MNFFTRTLRLTAISFSLILSSYGPVLAQKGTNVQKLQELSQQFKLKWEQENREAQNFANRNGIPFRIETGSSFAELQSVLDGIPMYYTTQNTISAATISTNKLLPGGLSGLNLDGTGITIHEWDAGAVLLTHQEYAGRAVMGDNATTTHYHSTHVAGTLIASGVAASARGMAPNANLRAFDWNSDESEMASEASAGALFSNHSYGYVRGWYYNGSAWVWYGNTSISTQEDYLFGFYDTQARDWDNIARNAPYYLIVKSAGNDRGDGPANGTYPQDGQYDCIAHSAISKNILTVGAVNDITAGYSGPSSVVMSSFSSWGPADDGRIKPDIVTNGIGLYSTDDDNNSDYTTLSGTSMASPSATGSLALLQQHYENLNGPGNYMLAATLKGLVISTADEAGLWPGPDYKFGWGLMNTEKAALKISEDQNINVIDELELVNGGTYTRTVHSDGLQPLSVTICWTDVAGAPVSASLDPANPMLVNDLDLKITFGGNTYYPWKLNRDDPAAAATNNSENNVDNIEMVFIGSPAAGDYIITVDHDGTLSGGSQAFSIIFDGISSNSIKKGPYLIFADNNTQMKVLWQDFETTTDMIRWGTNTSYTGGSASSTEYGTDHQHAYTITGLTPGTKYFYQVESGGSLYSGSFTAAPDASASAFKFLAYGDTRSYPDDHNLVAKEIINHYTADPGYQSLLISMGDLINNGNSETDWSSQFFETGLPYLNSMLANIPYQSCMGNHEGTGVLFQKYFPYNYQANRYYSFEYGPALFIVLDQYVPYTPGSAQYTWLVNTLSASQKQWKILYYHEPGWSAAGGHINNLTVQNYIQPLCEQYGVHITFAGHNHYYSRAEVTLNNTIVQHITTGGGGAPLRTTDPSQPFIVSASSSHHFCKVNIVNENIMEVEVIDKLGVRIDQFTINQSNNSQPAFTTDPVIEINALEDAAYSASIADNAGDPDQGDILVFSKVSGPSWLNISTGGDLTGTPLNGDVGLNKWIIKVDDQNGGTDQAELQITVINTNDAPVFSSENFYRPDAIVGALYSGTLAGEAFDEDGDELQFSITPSETWLSMAADGSYSGTPAPGDTGENSWTVYVNDGKGGNDQATLHITVKEPVIVNYCESHGSAISEWIASVSLGSTSNNSGSSGSAGYQNFTAGPVFTVDAGSLASFSLVPGFAGRSTFENWSVWIDFNGNGDFTDQGEQVFTTTKKRSSVTGSISIPSGLGLQTRMRVSMSPSGIPGPCDIFPAGEVEDYTVQIGETIPLPPVAEFTADQTVILTGTTIQFTDLSLNNPESWSWSFPGGDPSSSFSQNPLVTYNTEGIYDVSLTAANPQGSGLLEKTGYIVVSDTPPVTDYCPSTSGSNALEWISQVDIGGFSNPSGATGYSDFTGMTINLAPGSSPLVTLTPFFTGKPGREFWRVWIDFNADGDFDDADETVLTANNQKSAVTGNISIPSYASGQTRMRITMKNGSSPSPCEIFANGEVEDYTVSFSAGNDKSGMISGNYGQLASLTVYPNPADDRLIIQFKAWEGEKLIRLIDMTGRTVLYEIIRTEVSEIDVSSFPKGIYLLDAGNGQIREYRKITIL